MQFYSQPLVEHNEVPLGDEGRFEEILQYFERWQAASAKYHEGQNRCYVISVGNWTDDYIRDAAVNEMVSLVQAQGDQIVGQESIRLKRLLPRTYIGHGVAQAIADRAGELGADLLVLDAELSPSQLRNLEDAAGMAVCDREAVILNVFLKHAKTRNARIQVEMAHLDYLRPRIRGLGLDMDQQAGGVMGGRGPGETASEMAARHLDHRMGELRKAFAKLQRTHHTQGHHRDRCARAVLVGYTNAGKTSLMNALSSTRLSVRNRPFETLDTTTRCLSRRGDTVLLSDTVGFIRRLPSRLLASFESTLSSITDATLLVMVIDASDPEWGTHLAIAEQILQRLNADAHPRIYVFNKKDKLARPLEPSEIEQATRNHPYAVVCSRDKQDIDTLRTRIIRWAHPGQRLHKVFVPYKAAAVMDMIYQRCRVHFIAPKPHGLRLVIEASSDVIDRIENGLEEVRR